MANEFGRNIQDTGLKVTKVLPAAGASNNTDGIDLESIVGSPEGIEVEVSIPAMSGHTNASYSADIKLQHSTTNGTFLDLDTGTEALPDITIVTPGVTSTGSAARVVRFRLPRGINRYISFNQAVTSGGPSLVATTITYKLLF